MPNTLQTFKAEFFKALAHPLRIKILEALRESEKSVTELQNILECDQSGVSQQLAILRAKSLITARKNGTSVFYKVHDPLLFDLLDVARAIFNNQLIDTKDLLSQLET
jgi:ArsR family transcriptional regulator